MNRKFESAIPALLIDEKRCRVNILAMAEKARHAAAVFRPHFKTHQSLAVGRWFKEAGVNKITVSSIGMAHYFSSEWNDITVAFPVNILEIDTINALAESITLNLLVESVESAQFLSDNLKYETGCFLKIDVGTERTGIKPENSGLIDRILSVIEKSPNIRFRGFLAHAGHTYTADTKDEIRKIFQNSQIVMSTLKSAYIESFPQLIISLGDTPGFSIVDDFQGIDEIRPGNFVFYDLTQEKIGSCTFNQIGVAVACPVVAVHDDRNELIIYGGAIHFSKEILFDSEEGLIFGRVVERRAGGWGEVISGMILNKISQEHGTVRYPTNMSGRFKIGDLLYILPVHSCLTAANMKKYNTTEGTILPKYY